MKENCSNCEFCDQYRFCLKLVLDTKWTVVKNGKRIKSNYISDREENDERLAFIVPINFKCIFYKLKS